MVKDPPLDRSIGGCPFATETVEMARVLCPAVTALDGGGRRATARETMRVVIADDHETYRRGLARTIRRFGTLDLVGEAADGATALELILELSPDVALLDVRMPGLDGLELARRLRDLGGIAVVLLTGSETGELAGAAQAAGVAALLSKDMARDDICRRLLALR
jgi:two-component system nitrate/nitrite response regulator NarL